MKSFVKALLGSGAKILAMFGLALLILSVCVLLACFLRADKAGNSQNTAQNRQSTAQNPKVLKIAYSQNVGPLNPQGYNKNQMFAQNIIYEGLLKADKNGALIPSLATSFGIDKSGKIYTFHLRKGVRFSNGEEFNADAVVLNFASIIKSRVRHSWSGLAMALERAQKIDDYTVQLVLKEPYAPTLNELALPRPFRFLAPSAFPSDLDLVAQNPKPIGTGAYMLVESKLGAYDKFAKNPHYWDAQRLEAQGGFYYGEVIIKVIFEPNSKLSALRAGQVDMIYGVDEIPTRIFQEVRNQEVQKQEENPTNTPVNAPANASAKSNFRAYISKNDSFVTSLVINSTHIKEAPLRQAIALAIDKEAIVNAVYEGIIRPANSIFAHTAVSKMSASQNQNAQNQNLQSQSHQNAQNQFPTQSQNTQSQKAHALAHSRNTTKAREILSTLGYTQQNPLKLELFFFGDKPSQRLIAQVLQSQLKEAHIALSVRGLEPSMYANALRKGEFDMAFVDSWSAPYEPLSQLYSYTKQLGHGDYIAQSGLKEKSRIDSLILQAIKESATIQNLGQNPASRAQKSTHANSAQELSDEAIELLIQSGVYIPLVIERNKAIAHTRIKGVENVGILSYEIPIWDFYE